MATKRKFHPATFKAQVALAAVKGDKTVSELAGKHGVHPKMIHAWKKQLIDNAEELFQSGAKTASVEHEALQAQLYEQIGRLKTELDWLKKTTARDRAKTSLIRDNAAPGRPRETGVSSSIAPCA